MSQHPLYTLLTQNGLNDPSLLRTLIDSLPEQVYVKDTEGLYILNNLAHVRALGAASPEEIAGKSDFDFYPKELAERYRADEREVTRSGRPLIDKEEPSVDGEGNERWHSTTKVPLRDGDEKIVGLVGTTRDVTERRRAEEALKESEERFRTAFEDSPIGVALVGLDGRRFRVNQALCEMLGYSEEELCSEKYLEHIHPDDREISLKHRRETLEKGEGSYILERRYVHADGHTVWNLTSVSLIQDSQGNPSHLVCLHQDTTERKEAEEKLRESEERYRAVVEQSADAIWLFDPTSKQVLESNTAFQEMLGYTAEELQEMTNYDFVTHSRKDIDSAIQRIVQEGRGFFGERKYRRKDGTVLDIEVSGSVIPYQGEEVVCGVARDLTERKELEEQLRHQAFHDSLTDLPNRELLLDRLGHALARTRREGGTVAVLIMDLDDFKDVNDSLGHDAGNAVLIEVAERLRESVRPGDTVGRIFGDEFAVLLEAPAGREEASRVAERIGEGLQGPFDIEEQEIFVMASIGIAFGETDEDQPEEVLRHADLAMYEAKRGGKAEYKVYESNMHTRAVERMDLKKDLRRAIVREEFEVHYQPKVLLETEAMVGVEALARWNHPDRGLLLPTRFIPYAEETGLINQIGLWVLKESCRQFREWQERYPEKLDTPFGLCVNLSASDIHQPDLAEKVDEVLRETGLDSGCLMLEISERTAKEDVEQILDRLRELNEMGVGLALDDFGTGYCSLVYLEHSLLDVLKIDRLLVHRKREEDPEGCAKVISAMTSMAHSLDLAVIVEGVETEDQVAELKEIGCEMVQGHYFAEPLPSEDLEKLLQEGISF